MEHEQHADRRPVAVAVITPSGIFPDPDDYRRAFAGEIIQAVLDAAAKQLGLKETADWDAYVSNDKIDPTKSFAENDLCDIVEIEWHKREGGGGA